MRRLIGWKAITEKRHGICPKACLNSHMSYWILACRGPKCSSLSPVPRLKSQGTANGVRLLTVQSSLGFCTWHQGTKEYWRNWMELNSIYELYSFKFLPFNIARNRYYYILLSQLASWEATIANYNMAMHKMHDKQPQAITSSTSKLIDNGIRCPNRSSMRSPNHGISWLVTCTASVYWAALWVHRAWVPRPLWKNWSIRCIKHFKQPPLNSICGGGNYTDKIIQKLSLKMSQVCSFASLNLRHFFLILKKCLPILLWWDDAVEDCSAWAQKKKYTYEAQSGSITCFQSVWN